MDEQFDLDDQPRDRNSDDGWLRERLTVATLDEIRYAEHLRLQIRASYQRKALPPTFWSVGVE